MTSLALDASGNIYVAGGAYDASFVTKNAFQSEPPVAGGGYFMKLTPNARSTIFASYFGGSGGSTVTGIAVDAKGSIYLGGVAESSDFLVKATLQPFKGGGILNSDLFAAKFAPDGQTLLYSTLIGGTGNETGGRLTVDASGTVYMIGDTLSADFPVKNAFQTTFGGGNGDGVLMKLSDSTPLPDSPLKPSPTQVSFRFVQGGKSPATQAITVTGGSFTVVSVSAPWLAATASGQTLNLAVNPTGLAPGSYSGAVTLMPGVGPAASVTAVLSVLSPAPLLASLDPVLVPAGSDDTVITIHGSGFNKDSVVQVDGLPWMTTPVLFADAGTLKLTLPMVYFSVLSNHTVAVQNPQSPLSNILSVAVGQPAPYFTAASVVNAASFASGPVAPGEIVTVFGTNLGSNAAFDFTPTTVVFASPTQMSVAVPYSASGKTTTLRIGSSVPVTLDLAPSAPGIFAAVANGDGTLTLYATGCGILTQDALPQCQLPVSATVNKEQAQVLYAGVAPGLVQGANQINILLPGDITTGPVSIVLTAGAASSKPYPYALP